MNTLDDVRILAEQLLTKTFKIIVNGNVHYINPSYDLGYDFKFDSARRRLGCCWHRRKKITLSKALVEANLDKLNGKLKDTILHEIAHALSVKIHGMNFGRGHGENWVDIARQIGCDGERYYNAEDVTTIKAKYTLVCPTCGRITTRHRLVKTMACGKCCNGRYNKEHIFIVEKNY